MSIIENLPATSVHFGRVEPYRGGVDPTPASPPPAMEGVRAILSILRRRWLPFVATLALVILAVAVYTWRQTPEYTANATLLVNSRVLNLSTKDQTEVFRPGADEDRAVSAEVQIMQSNGVAERVIAAMTRRMPTFASAITELPPKAAAGEILDAVKARTRIDRPGATNVLGVSFTAADPVLAAEVTNEFARQYLAFKGDDRLGAARTADVGLRRELEAMRGRVEQAEAAVAEYRRANNLLSADGVTLTERDQSLFRQQSAAAETDLAEAQARLNTARAQMKRGSRGDDVGEALGSPVINQLRGQRAIAAAKLADLQARYQPSHPRVIDARDEVASIDGEIQREIGRVVSNLEAKVSVARQRAGTATGIAGQSRGELAANAQASVKLNELERRAEALRTNYAGMLQRQTAVASQAVVADVDARLLSSATVPKRPSAPNKKINLVLGGMLGLILASAVVAALHLFDQKLTSSKAVEDDLDLPHLVNVPLIRSIAEPGERGIAPVDFVLERPYSMIAESMRSLLLTAEKGPRPQGPRIVGVISSLPREGKSTVASALARVAASSGRRTLIIDADIRRPSIAAIFGKTPSVGLIDVLAGTATLEDALLQDERSGAWILPALVQPFRPTEISSERVLRSFVASLNGKFDLVIVDVAPALAAAESRLLMNIVDRAIMVVRWNHTPAPVVRAALKRLEALGVRPAGVVMTQVDMNAIAAYSVDDVDHQYRSWGGYYS